VSLVVCCAGVCVFRWRDIPLMPANVTTV
jgi:hypothetical protein